MLQGLPTSTYATTPAIYTGIFDMNKIPSTSAVQSGSISTEDIVNTHEINSINNTVINVPTDLQNPGFSNRIEPSINLTCHNCTINFYK